MTALGTMIIFAPDLESNQSIKANRSRSAAPYSRAAPQSNRVPSARDLSRFLNEAQAAVKLRGQVSVLLTTDKAIRRLNRRFRGKNKATDVLSFPTYFLASNGKVSSGKPRIGSGAPTHVYKAGRYAPPIIAGDLAISVDTAQKQAAAEGHSVAVEIKVLMLHGLLHLAGYDHETDGGGMARLEEKLRARLMLPHGLIERSVCA